MAVSAAEEGKQSKQAEQEGEHQADIFSGSAPPDQSLGAGRSFGEGQVVGVLPDGHKQLLALELCGGESFIAWKGCLEDLVERGLRAPVLASDHRWQSRVAPSGRRGVATNGRATLLCAQAAQPRAESPEARPLGDPGRLPSRRLRGQR